jgi:hypothetical protein
MRDGAVKRGSRNEKPPPRTPYSEYWGFRLP